MRGVHSDRSAHAIHPVPWRIGAKLWPADDEASLFYALSLLTSPDAKNNDFAVTRRAIVLLNGVFSATQITQARLTI